MPTYEYECSSCGHTFEAFQRMSDAPLTSCPECGNSVRRLIFGGTGVIFKGSGFYVNDSRKSTSGSPKAGTPSSDGSKESASTPSPAKDSSSQAKVQESA